MSFFAMLRRLVVGRDLEQEAIELVDSLEDRAWMMMQRRAGSLTRHEIRGYVRARSACMLNEAIGQQQLSRKLSSTLRTLALTELTERLQARLILQPAATYQRAA